MTSNDRATTLRLEAERFYWYHRIDLGDGVVIEGDFDMSPHVDAFRFPNDMRGLRVLDVGRASGFFSFEFERRGAETIATELGSFLDWDFVGGEAERARIAAEIRDERRFTERYVTGAFNFAHAQRKSAVDRRTSTIYDISQATMGGPFDLVFAGSILSYVRDPIGALMRLRSVMKPGGVCIVSIRFRELPSSIPLTAFIGTKDLDRRTWWAANEPGLIEMLHCSGFDMAEIVGRFVLKRLHAKANHAAYPFIVAHAKTIPQAWLR